MPVSSTADSDMKDKRRSLSLCSNDSSSLWDNRSENQRTYEDWKHCKWGEDAYDLVELDADDLDLDVFGDVELPTRDQVVKRLRSMIDDSLATTGIGWTLLRRQLGATSRRFLSHKAKSSPIERLAAVTEEDEAPLTIWDRVRAVAAWCVSPWRVPVILNVGRALSCPRRQACPRRKKNP